MPNDMPSLLTWMQLECKCICLGKTHISGMMSTYNMSAILISVLYEPLSWKYIISRSLSSLLIELTFRGLRNFVAVQYPRLYICNNNYLTQLLTSGDLWSLWYNIHYPRLYICNDIYLTQLLTSGDL